VNRKSISTSFNSKEIEAIDRVCAKLGITRGRLIKEAVTFWILEKPFEAWVKKYPHAAEAFAVVVNDMGFVKKSKKKKLMPSLDRYDKSFLAKAVYELEKSLPELDEHHDAYHELAKKKKIGAPKKSKKKPGRPKDKGR